MTRRLGSKFTVRSFDITGICPDYLVAVGRASASLRGGYYLFLVLTGEQNFSLAAPQETVLTSEWPLFLLEKEQVLPIGTNCLNCAHLPHRVS